MTETEIFFDRDRINKVCLMLKYMSLTVPLERIDSLKNSVSCKTAGEILHTILMDSVWMTKEDGNKETPFVSGFIKCKFDYDWNQLFNELTEAFSVLKKKEEISLYESNYTGGYYGEVYQACSTYDYAENKTGMAQATRKAASSLSGRQSQERNSLRKMSQIFVTVIVLILIVTLAVLATEFTFLKNIEEKKAEQMYYEEMFPQPKMNLIGKKPFTIIPAYDDRFILIHPELKEYFVCKVPAERIFSTKLNIDFSDGTWQLSVNKHTDEIVRAQFSKDGKYVLVSGIKEGNAVIDISREGEVYGGSIFVRVEEPEEWYEKLQEEMKSIPKRR